MHDSVIQVTITAFFGLLGVFVGTWLTRRTEYEKWYRQEKSLAFADYLYELHNVRLNASEAFYSQEGTELDRSMQATTEFVKLGRFASRARLYMSPDVRISLIQLQNELWALCVSRDGPTSNSTKVKLMMESIQFLIEAELEYLPDNPIWKFWAEQKN